MCTKLGKVLKIAERLLVFLAATKAWEYDQPLTGVLAVMHHGQAAVVEMDHENRIVNVVEICDPQIAYTLWEDHSRPNRFSPVRSAW